MFRSLRNLVAPSFAVLALSLASSAQAGFTLVINSLSPASVTSGGTTFTFAPSTTPQTFSGASNANVIDVAAASTTTGTPDTGSATLTENITLTGTGVSAGLSETFNFVSTFTLISGQMGAILSTVTPVSFTPTTGSGFAVSFAGYAAPSPTSSGGTLAGGNISLTIIPSAVPEPASLAMLGLGLVGTAGFAARRRMIAA